MVPVFRKALAGFIFLGMWIGWAGLLLPQNARAQDAAVTSPDHVYRIVILSGQNFATANHTKSWLESLNYSPIIVEQQTPTSYRVLYGYFPTQEIARQSLAKLQSDGMVSATEIVQTPTSIMPKNANPEEPVTWSVFLQEFSDEAQAQAFKSQVQQMGTSPVLIRNVNSFFQVYAGNGNSEEIDRLFNRLRDQGFTLNGVSKPVVSPADLPTPTPAPEGFVGIAQPETDTNAGIPSGIVNSDIWKSLSDEQKRQVTSSIAIQQSVRSGDAVAQQVIDIDKRLNNLSDQVKGVIKQIDDENDRRQKAVKQIKDKEEEAEHQISAGRFNDAALIYKEIVGLDKDNTYGQLAYAQRRLEFAQRSLGGEEYEGQKEANQRRYEQLKRDIEPLSNSQDPKDLEEAIGLWQQIKTMDPAQYGQEATGQISNLRRSIDEIDKKNKEDQELAGKTQQRYIWGLSGGFGLLLIVIIVVSLRQHGRHREIMTRMHEITAMRPMRELTGGGTANLLGGPGATGGDTDIFKPKASATSSGTDPGSLDPLGGLEPEPVKKKKGKGAAPEAPPVTEPSSGGFDDVFGGLGGSSPDTESISKGSDFGFDDIFAAPTGQTGQVTAAPTSASDAGGDTTFGGLFGGSGMTAKAGSDAPPVEQHQQVGPISFDDLVAAPDDHQPAPAKPASATPAAATTSAHDDLMSVFGNVGGSEGGNGQQPAPPALGGLDHLADSPFANFMNDSTPGEAKPPVRQVEDDTEIPSIRLDMGDSHGGPASSSFGQDSKVPAPENESTSTSLDLPSFSFEDFTAIESVAQPAAAGAAAAAAAATQLSGTASAAFAGAELDFEEDPVGQPPMGWEGEYPFASLLVKSDTPPRGAHQYLAFEKKEGAGKALYTYRFPAIGGVITIEFDLRCNDKNKFLLGFYVEKDGDFQQSVHTKILRSEAQTTPTIHMQGESAPYLLGSWAHIKYVVDLTKGKLDGYIDSTHVARDLTLTPNPGALNTLSIRDNINTTGVLLLDNIRITQGAA